MSERLPTAPVAQHDAAGEPPPALASLVENHPHHAALLWGQSLRCVALSRPLRRFVVEFLGHEPAEAGLLLASALREPARRALHAGQGEIVAARLLGQTVEGVQLCPAGLGGLVVLLPSLSGAGPEAVRRTPREPATLRGILDALPLPLLVAFGARGEDRLLNRAARDMLGASARDEATGESLFALEARWGMQRGDGSPLPEEARPLRRALRQREKVLGVEVSFSLSSFSGDSASGADPDGGPGADERRVFLESAAPIIGHGGELLGAVAVFQEITEQKRADRRKDQFLAMAGHELRTPLTVLRTQTQLISRWLDELPAEQVRQVAEGIDLQTERLSHLVDDLLDVGRLATGNVEIRAQPIELLRLARDVVARSVGTTTQYRFEVDCAAAEVWIDGDALRVEQVIENLLANAQRLSPPGSTIALRLWREEGSGRVSVRDWGAGIAPEDRERIFERFHQPERASRGESAGLGLGLWISRKVVELMGGRIWVDSEGPGLGAVITFQLPLSPAAPAG